MTNQSWKSMISTIGSSKFVSCRELETLRFSTAKAMSLRKLACAKFLRLNGSRIASLRSRLATLLFATLA